jgi:hypothetical protein
VFTLTPTSPLLVEFRKHPSKLKLVLTTGGKRTLVVAVIGTPAGSAKHCALKLAPATFAPCIHSLSALVVLAKLRVVAVSDDVAACEIVIEDDETIVEITVFAGMPLPVTAIPTTSVLVLIERLSTVVVVWVFAVAEGAVLTVAPVVFVQTHDPVTCDNVKTPFDPLPPPEIEAQPNPVLVVHCNALEAELQLGMAKSDGAAGDEPGFALTVLPFIKARLALEIG